MRKTNYDGVYQIKRTPTRMTAHNAKSWAKIEKAMAINDGQEQFDVLASTVKDHRHGARSARYPYQFITYCIRQGWLQRVK